MERDRKAIVENTSVKVPIHSEDGILKACRERVDRNNS